MPRPQPNPVPGNRRVLLCLLAAAVLSATAMAQRFVFVSSRAPEADYFAYDRPWQSEIFVYRDGSEIRLTHTTHASEYDPAPSPDGRLVAYVALDHTDESARESWSWYLGIVDALTAREVARWPLPNSVGMTRPSGGFQPTWVGAETVWVQAPDENLEWQVLAYALGQRSPQLVTHGFGIVRHGAGGLVATERSDGTYLVDPAAGSEQRLTTGTPLAWWHDSLFVAQLNRLLLVATETGAARAVSEEPGFYSELELNPSATLYAYLRVGSEGVGTELVVADEAHQVVMEFVDDGWLSSLDWLDDERLVVARESLDGDVEVLTLDLLARGLIVNSSGVDHSPRAMPMGM